MHKDTRWVEWSGGKTPVVNVPDALWDQYCTFAERVITPTLELLHRRADDPVKGGIKDYTFTYSSATGTATLSGLPSGVNCKKLYSTDTSWKAAPVITMGSWGIYECASWD